MRSVPVGWRVETTTTGRWVAVRITTPEGLSAKAEGSSLIKAREEALEWLERRTGPDAEMWWRFDEAQAKAGTGENESLDGTPEGTALWERHQARKRQGS